MKFWDGFLRVVSVLTFMLVIAFLFFWVAFLLDYFPV